MSYALYRRLFSRALGEGAYSVLSGIDMTDADFRGLQKELGLAAGQRLIDHQRGKSYRIVRARSAFAAGNSLKLYFGAAGRNPTMVASGATRLQAATNKTLLNADVAGGEIFFYGGTDAYDSRYILNADGAAGASIITVAEVDTSIPGQNLAGASVPPDAWTAAPDGTTTAQIVVGYELTQTTAATDSTKAIALGTVTSGNWTVVQEGGLGLVLIDGTSAVSVGSNITPGATAGTAVIAPATAAGSAAIFAQALAAYSTASANLILCDLFCGRFNLGSTMA